MSNAIIISMYLTIIFAIISSWKKNMTTNICRNLNFQGIVFLTNKPGDILDQQFYKRDWKSEKLRTTKMSIKIKSSLAWSLCVRWAKNIIQIARKVNTFTYRKSWEFKIYTWKYTYGILMCLFVTELT